MAPKHLRGVPHIIDPGAAVPPALDLSRRQSEHRAANHRLLARLKALERSQKTHTPRAYVRRYGREQESLILGLPLQGTPSPGAQALTDVNTHVSAESSFGPIPFTNFCRAGRPALTERRK